MRGRAIPPPAPARPLRWVLFRESPNTHREVYFTAMRVLGHGAHGAILTTNHTSDADQARSFASAADAYDFGALHNLIHWRAGKR